MAAQHLTVVSAPQFPQTEPQCNFLAVEREIQRMYAIVDRQMAEYLRNQAVNRG